MMEEWRVEHSERMDCWMDEEGLSLLLLLVVLLLVLTLPFLSSSDDDGDGDANGFLDQLHVDEYLADDNCTTDSILVVGCMTLL
jgi:hypothetical protein